MSGNPLVAQGTLNRGLVSLSLVTNPQLNVTTGFFGTKMARLTFEGETSDYIATATGGVPSGRLFQFATVTAYLNKSQNLAALWELQRLTNSNIGDVVLVTDSPVISSYYLFNCILQNIPDLDLTGESNDFPVVIRGSYPINSGLFV
jgi:hypothetical protein